MASMRSGTQHTYRQRGSVALGWVAMVGCLGTVLASLPRLDLTFTGVMLLVAASAFVLLVRPSLQLSPAGVHVNNPVRRTVIPWPLVEDCLARWNLQVRAGEQVVTAWAIAAHIDRPRRPGLSGAALAWPTGGQAAREEPGAQAAVTASALARLVEQGRAEYDAAVASGALAADDGGRAVVRTWELLDVALLLAPVLLLVAGVVTRG